MHPTIPAPRTAEVQVGDTVKLVGSHGRYGVVTGIAPDPFRPGSTLLQVTWPNGQTEWRRPRQLRLLGA